MILGLLMIVLILYDLVLFWVLNERLKTLLQAIRKSGEQVKKMEEKISLLLSMNEEGRNEGIKEEVKESFSVDTLVDSEESPHTKGD
ncbi:MAG: hypothetical protein WCP87_07405 [Atribacterota bacterium]|nr:hypothetical protein [Candidatus Atribacteria bacterium]